MFTLPSATSRVTTSVCYFKPFGLSLSLARTLRLSFIHKKNNMFSGGKLEQDCSKELSQRLEEDRISQLPDPLLSDILSHLPIKEAVKTSVLSTRWRSLWLLVSKLELEYWDFGNIDTFMSFGGRFFDSNRVLDNLKLTLLVNENNMGVDVVSSVTSWIDASLKHKVQNLHVRFPYEMPLSLYTCKTLVSLILYRVALPNAEFVSLPRLKTMHLIAAIWDPIEATFERLVSSCPVLEELEVQERVNFDQKVYRVHSRSLKRLNIVRGSTVRVDYVPGVVIDAPQLCCLRIIDDVSKSFIVNDLEFIAKLEISLTFGLEGLSEASMSSGRSHIRSFLAGISNVRDMTICANTFKVLHYYSISELLPQFGYMSRLCVTLDAPPNFIWLATFLESCPNLKSLVLVSYYYRGQSSDNHIIFSHVPECLLSSLECVDFQFTFSGLVVEMKLARYFLENSAVLKKLTLHVDSRSKESFKILSEIPRASTECELSLLKSRRETCEVGIDR